VIECFQDQRLHVATKLSSDHYVANDLCTKSCITFFQVNVDFIQCATIQLLLLTSRHAGTVSGQVGQEKYGGHFHYFLMTTALYKL